MEEAHSSAYAMHPRSTKMYHTLREHYWWRGMKKDVSEFISRCLASKTCRALTVSSYPSMEMGENHDGFCGRTAALP